MRRLPCLFLFLFLCAAPACADVTVTKEALGYVNVLRSFNRLVSDLEVFYRISAPRVALGLDDKERKSLDRIRDGLTKDGLYGALPKEIPGYETDILPEKVYWIEMTGQNVVLTEPEKLAGNIPRQSFFVSAVRLPLPLPEAFAERIAAYRNGIYDRETKTVLFYFLPSVMDVGFYVNALPESK